MTPKPEESKEAAGARKAPEPPRQQERYAFQRKALIVLAMLVLGLPVFVVLFSPPVAGGLILWHQIGLYRQDGRWRAFSLFELATNTVDRDLTDKLRWPALSLCSETGRNREPAENPNGLSGQRIPVGIEGGCAELGPAQSWLLRPNASSGWHRNLVRVLRFIPVSSLLFLVGLTISYVFRLIEIGRRAGKPSPAPPPAATGSGITPRRVSSSQESGVHHPKE